MQAIVPAVAAERPAQSTEIAETRTDQVFLFGVKIMLLDRADRWCCCR